MDGALYKRLYHYLFNSVTDALEAETISEMREILINAQVEAEEIYVSFAEDE